MGTVSAKALWQGCAWCIGGTARRLVGLEPRVSTGERAGDRTERGLGPRALWDTVRTLV